MVITDLILFLLITQGSLPWQPILGLKWAKLADSLSFVALAFLHGVQYRNTVYNSSYLMIWIYRVKIW